MEKANKKTWYTTKVDEKGVEVIDRVQPTCEGEKPVPEHLNWKLSPANNVLHPETPLERYDENMRYLDDDEWCAKQGKANPKGVWYHKGRTEQNIIVYDVDSEPPGDDYTKEPPLENEPYQIFDGKKNKWVVDAEKKERAEKEAELGKLKAEIEEAERKQYRSWKAIESKTADDDDVKFFNEYEAIITSRRLQVKALEDELKSA